MGEIAPWQELEIGYQLGADIGGPMNLGEEYRWNLNNITYGFDPSFLDYFGQDGVDVVEEVVQELNELPAMNQLSPDLSEFPLDTRRFNHRASALGIFDIKSWSLAIVLEELGLTSPERFVWTLRSRVVINDIPIYAVYRRNFDPVTWEPSSFVNGSLYTYQVLQTFVDPDVWEAVPLNVDPFAPSITSVVSLSAIDEGTVDFRGLNTLFSPGLYYDGLTRDDVGGLRYIYRRNNFNVENIPPGVGISTNFVSGGGDPWGQVGGGPGAGPGVTNFVDIALRPGVNKLQLERVFYNSQLGEFIPSTNRYTDTFVTNGVVREQRVQRVVTQPDILFGAADLGVSANGIPFIYSRSISFQNNDAINGNTALDGPGQVIPQVQITFAKIAHHFINIPEGGEAQGVRGFVWGHYDSSTNAPIIFPKGSSIKELEAQVLGSRTGGGGSTPWEVPVVTPPPGGGGGQAGGGGGTTPPIGGP